MRPVQQGDADREHRLEHEQLRGDGAGLSEEDPGGIEAREAEPVPGGVGRLDGIAALHCEHRRQQDRDPEQTGRRRREDLPVRAERQAEQQQDRDRERPDLVEADPGAELDPEVLSGHERGVTQHGPMLP